MDNKIVQKQNLINEHQGMLDKWLNVPDPTSEIKDKIKYERKLVARYTAELRRLLAANQTLANKPDPTEPDVLPPAIITDKPPSVAKTTAKVKLPRCPKGFTRNKRTLLCDPKKPNLDAKPSHEENTSDQNAPNIAVPVSEPTNVTAAIPVSDTTADELVPGPVTTPVAEPVATTKPANKIIFKRCGKGTRRNKKTGDCEPIKKKPPVAEPQLHAKPLGEPSEENMDINTSDKMAAPVAAPVATPVTTPVAAQVATPVAAQVATPDATPVTTPVATPVTTPVATPVTTPHLHEENMDTSNQTVTPVVAPPVATIGEPSENASDQQPEPIVIDSPLEEPSQNATEKQVNQYKRTLEKQQYAEEATDDDPALAEYTYPTVNDPNFQSKIASKREFAENKYIAPIADIKHHSDLLCRAEFEHLPHQQFVRHFLSPQTPYRSLLLFHGLGTGKTCTAIGVCEEFRAQIKQMPVFQQHRIIIVGSENVKSNFRKQLFDEQRIRKLAEENGNQFSIYDIQSCTGASLFQEVNPTSMDGLSLDASIKQINALIDQHYSFFGYTKLANFIHQVLTKGQGAKGAKGRASSQEDRVAKIRKHFTGRLIVVDEAHNLRSSKDNDNEDGKKTLNLLLDVVKYADNVRLLLLSATPAYNSPEEVLWWINLFQINDRRSTIARAEVFTQDAFSSEDTVDIFKPQTDQEEGGKELLRRKLTGYVSYVRGENPYSFPYRVYPSVFLTSDQIAEHSLTPNNTPRVQMNGRPITVPIQHIPVYVSKLAPTSYQHKMYTTLIEYYKHHTFGYEDKSGVWHEKVGFAEMDSFGYTQLQLPILCLDMVFPTVDVGQLDTLNADTTGGQGDPKEVQEEDPGNQDDDDQDDVLAIQQDVPTLAKPITVKPKQDTVWFQKRGLVSASIGTKGMSATMKWSETKGQKHDYEYKPETFAKFGRFLSADQLRQYSHKIHQIQQCILHSTGIVLVYSEYMDGCIIPFALALEELGFERHIPTGSNFSSTLFNPNAQNFNKIDKRDALTMKTRTEIMQQAGAFKQAKYALITGDKMFSPNSSGDISIITSSQNKQGELVKVLLITRAAFEGVDFKCVRQVHIMEPWFNMNRIEQIIGRGVRNNSHCALPFEERNTEIYLHGTLLPPEDDKGLAEEAADIYMFRIAERKAKKIGQVTRLIKENAVDCVINISQTKFTVQDLQTIASNQNVQITLPTDKRQVQMTVGDKPYTDLCDYMDNCAFQCKNPATNDGDMLSPQYSQTVLQSNRPAILKQIRALFREDVVYTNKMIINRINHAAKEYPEIQINDALTYLVENSGEKLTDKYGRQGRLTQKGVYYAFLPDEIQDLRTSVLDRTAPIDHKPATVKVATQQQKPQTIKASQHEVVGPAPEEEEDFSAELDALEAKLAAKRDALHLQATYAAQLIVNLGVNDVTPDYAETLLVFKDMDQLSTEERLLLARRPHPYFTSKTLEVKIMGQTHNVLLLADPVKNITAWSLTLAPPNKDEVDQIYGWWPIGEYDYKTYVAPAAKQKLGVEPTSINSLFGFYGFFVKRDEVVFYVKSLANTHKNNTGARVDQSHISAIQTYLRKLLRLGDDHVFDVSAKYSKQTWFHAFMTICAAMDRKYKGKKTFFTLEESVFNKVDKLLCRLDGNLDVIHC